LEKTTEVFDILLFQENKLRDCTAFPLSDFVFPPEGVCSGLAYAYQRNYICTVTLLDSTTFVTDDRQLEILQIHDPRLHKPLTLVNLYVRGGSAADSCQWDFLWGLSDTYENLIVVGDFNARHFSWNSTGVNPYGKGLAAALLDVDLHLLNTGEPTRLAERSGDTDSCTDLTLCSSDLQSRLTWKLGSHVDSDHLLCEVHCRVRYANRLFKYKHPYD